MKHGVRFLGIVVVTVLCLSVCFAFIGSGSTGLEAQGAGLPPAFKVGVQIDRGSFVLDIKELRGDWMRALVVSNRQQGSFPSVGAELWWHIPSGSNYYFVATPAP